MSNLYQKFKVRIKFRNRIYGGIPLSKELIQRYVDAKFPPGDPQFVEKLSAEVVPPDDKAREQELVKETESITTGFKHDAEGYYIGDYIVKAHLKQAASLLRITQKKRGSKDTVKEATFIKPEKLYLGKEIGGVDQFCGNVRTPQGDRSILKASQYFERPEIEFEVWLLAVRTDKFDAADLRICFEFGQELGIGSNRTYETGKYDLVSFVDL
jgi:hypothetical protein